MVNHVKKSENPKAFKHWIDKKLLLRMAAAIQEVHPDFDQKKFLALTPHLEKLELKARVQHVRDQLHHQLPQNYKKALKILCDSLRSQKLKGFDLWPYTEFVQTYGLDHPALSLKALHHLTQLFTGEFAVRPFLKKHPKVTLDFLLKCTMDQNVHVRRWVSEGTRPRLPWGERLGDFVNDPRPTIALLENLKYDEELYVRKSVANHLNDIAKDHPELLFPILKKWQNTADLNHQKKITWITQRALRTLIKEGHPEALALIGVSSQIKINVKHLKIQKKTFSLNETLSFEFQVQSDSQKPQRLIIDYIIHHVKANQKTTPKVFKLKSLTLGAGETLRIKKNHPLKKITTRKYYSGTHLLEIQINGKVYAALKWELKA